MKNMRSLVMPFVVGLVLAAAGGCGKDKKADPAPAAAPPAATKATTTMTTTTTTTTTTPAPTTPAKPDGTGSAAGKGW